MISSHVSNIICPALEAQQQQQPVVIASINNSGSAWLAAALQAAELTSTILQALDHVKTESWNAQGKCLQDLCSGSSTSTADLG
jgi:hypothetical protein